MGNGEIAAVSDAGPLVHLSEIECLSLLPIFKSLHIPGAVWQETVGQNRVSATHLGQLENIQRHVLPQLEVSQFVQENNLSSLHWGEQECLCLCDRLGVPILLTDDLMVRDTARQFGLTPVGSLGIVIKAYYVGRISIVEAEQCLRDLYEISSLFVTSAIVELAMEQIRRDSR